MKKIINLHETAALLNLSPQTIKNHVLSKNMPVSEKGSRGKDWEFDSEAVLAWYGDYKQGYNSKASGKDVKSYEESRQRKMSAEATLAEIQVDKEKGRLVSIDDIVSVVDAEYSRVRAKLLSIPSKVSPALYMIDDLMETQSILENAINEVLEELQQDV